MNEMYEMSIISHSYSVIGLLFAILLNFLFAMRIDDVKRYKRAMSMYVFVIPMFLSAVIFTGIVMMAAKHLDFTIENNIMIGFSIIMIILEAKKAKFVKFYPSQNEISVLQKKIYKVLSIELILLLSISLWMWR